MIEIKMYVGNDPASLTALSTFLSALAKNETPCVPTPTAAASDYAEGVKSFIEDVKPVDLSVDPIVQSDKNDAPPTEEKKKRKSPTKKTEAVAEPEAKKPVEIDDDLIGETPKANGHAKKEITKDDLVDATQNAVFRNQANKAKIREFLDQFSAPKVGDLPVKEWDTFITFANELS